MATSELPIGTVVASVFPPDEFAALVGDDGRFNPQSSQWVPADGRSVKGSSYAKALKNSELVHEYVRENAPDLRGVFVRGLNYSNIQSVQQDDNFKDKQDGLPEPNAVTQQGYRMAGTRQLDSINKHDVTLPGQHQVAATMQDSGRFLLRTTMARKLSQYRERVRRLDQKTLRYFIMSRSIKACDLCCRIANSTPSVMQRWWQEGAGGRGHASVPDLREAVT